MAMSGESIRAQALRCACTVVEYGTPEDTIIAMASRFEAWIAGGAALSPAGAMPVHRGPRSPVLDLTPGEAALAAENEKKKPTGGKKRYQQAHTPPCYEGTCPACDMARARDEI